MIHYVDSQYNPKFWYGSSQIWIIDQKCHSKKLDLQICEPPYQNFEIILNVDIMDPPDYFLSHILVDSD